MIPFCKELRNEPRNPAHVAIIDDHPWMRLGLRSLLEEGKFRVIWEAESANEAMSHLERNVPDVALVDISLKGERDGIELTGCLRAAQSSLILVVLSMHAEPKYASRALAAGANAYLIKSEAPETILDTINQLLESALPRWPALQG